MEFSYFSPHEIHFGWGKRRHAGPLARKLGRSAAIILGSRTLGESSEYRQLLESLTSAGVDTHPLARIHREPQVTDVDRMTEELLRRQASDGVEFLIAIGGGSAIDLAKAVAAMATNREGKSVTDYLEGVGRGLTVTNPPLPVMAVPTTAGTGSEATKNAVISSDDPPFKKSLRSDLMLPNLVMVDPELTVAVPPTTTAFAGMDAITQCIESYISRRAQPIPQSLALQGVRLAIPSIEEAVTQPHSRTARENMAYAALLSGMALANSGLGMAHGVAAALGIHAKVPHGLACAVMLPPTLRENATVATDRLFELATACGHPFHVTRKPAIVEEFISRIEQICRNVNIPRTLGELGVRREQLPAIIEGSRGNSMNGNPQELSDERLLELLENML